MAESALLAAEVRLRFGGREVKSTADAVVPGGAPVAEVPHMARQVVATATSDLLAMLGAVTGDAHAEDAVRLQHACERVQAFLDAWNAWTDSEDSHVADVVATARTEADRLMLMRVDLVTMLRALAVAE